jgi:hypothetical protein
MRDMKIEYAPYRDDAFFEPGNRKEYFSAIPPNSLRSALVFIDPDVELEPANARQMRRGGAEKYLRYDEVVELVRRADSSAVIVYQHLQRDKRRIAGDILEKASNLTRVVGMESVGYVTDDNVAFFGIGTTPTVHTALISVFERYGAKHNLAAGALTPAEDSQ